MAGKASLSSKPHERRTIQINGTLTALAMAMAFYILYNFVPIPVPHLPSTLDKLIFTLRLQSFSGSCLVVAILIVSLARLFLIAVDPINGNGEHLVAFKVRFLTNTLEQFVVSFIGQLILTTYLTQAQMKIIPILVIFFIFGRISFYIGYSASYLKRTMGFVATFGVSAIVWCFNLYFVLNDFVL